MTTEELLQPRYKVIADWPNTDYKVGEIVIPCNLQFFNKYPHLFKKLEWWEQREVADMPEWVKDITANPIRFIKTELWIWDKNIGYNYFINDELQIVNMWALQPSTEQEFQDYQSKHQAQ